MEFPLYIESKKESMPNEIPEVNMHAQNFQEPKPKENEMPSEKGYQIDKPSLGRYH